MLIYLPQPALPGPALNAGGRRRCPTKASIIRIFPESLLWTAYLADRVDPAKPTVGLWFYQTYWLNNNLTFIDAIIRSVEAAGANVIPVFHLRYKDADRGNHGADHIVDHFFMDGDTPRIQVLINPLMFSLTLVSPEYRPLYPRLNVPVIQAMTCLCPRDQWEESLQGLPTMDVAYSVAQPEFDGTLITVPVATREEASVDPLTGALLAKHMPITERVNKMVRLSLNWARLARTPNERRRVAVVFHHYPPRNDRIGCAAGLDSFASVKLLLDHLKTEGYHLERTFTDGDGLAHEILSRMTCDQRWLPMDQLAERSEAHAGAESFGPWHAELPDTVREKMTADWGPVPGDLFVHDSRMHFAGMLNGNLFLTVQPPRGYLENIDKIYHDMHLSPAPSLPGPVSVDPGCFQSPRGDARWQARFPGVAAGQGFGTFGDLLSRSFHHGIAQYLPLHHQRSG